MPELEIHTDDGGQRLDRFLRKLMPGATLAHVFKLLRQGRIRVNGEKAAGKLRLAGGDTVRLEIADQVWDALRARRRPVAKAEPLEILYCDEHIVAIDKPALLPVHGGSGVGEDHVVTRLLAMLGTNEALTFRPAPAHRLDRETSGVLLCGRTAEGLRGVSALFRAREVEKHYVALVEGYPDPAEGTVDVPLRRRTHGSRVEPKVVPDQALGQPARSHYRVLRGHAVAALVEVELETGRTHQIRAHMASLGHPVFGDVRYGARDAPGDGRIFLHSARVAFVHPLTGVDVVAQAPVPGTFASLLDELAPA